MIREIQVPEEIAALVGLHGVHFRNLGRHVVLAGPNGAGKTRCLNLVAEVANAAAETQAFPKEALESGIRNAETNIASFLEQYQTNAFIGKAITRKVESATEELAVLRRKILVRDAVQFSTDEFTQKQRLRPLSLELLPSKKIPPPDALTREDFDRVIDANCAGGFKNSYRSIHAYLDFVAQSLYALEHPAEKSPQEFEKLHNVAMFNKISASLLQGEVSYRLGDRSRPVPIFKNRLFNADELSAGERILLSWAIILHRQQAWLHDSILFIDEPDLCLHPDVAVQTLRRLDREILGEHGQIWIATHNLAILADIGLDAIYVVAEGTTKFAGRSHIQSVIESLLGGVEGRAKLSEFIRSADEIAFARFALECILPPSVASHKATDKQEVQFRELMGRAVADSETLRILDFASGRGRLLMALSEGIQSVPPSRYDCYAFNEADFVSPSDREACKLSLRALYGPEGDQNRYYENRADLKAFRKEYFDIIVLSNVLHEVDVIQWTRLFRDLAELLSSSGHLVIIEDLYPPIGELPNLRGYVMLEPNSLAVLFGGQTAVAIIDSRDDGRLVGVRVPKCFVSQVSGARIRAALCHARDHALNEVRSLRQLPIEHRNARTGHRHAHYSTLFTNLQLALEVVPE